MVGVCGVAGALEPWIDELIEPLYWSNAETARTTAGDRLAVATVTHGDSDSPARTEGHDMIWTFGEIHGFEGSRGYEPRYNGRYTDPEYIARLYSDHGPDFAAGMNAAASVFIHRRDCGELLVVTDRLGTHPVYYAPVDGGVVFSTSIQSLPRHPAVDPTLDIEHVYEYLAFGRVAGIDTPFETVETLPPGSITTVDLTTGEYATEEYWQLHYNPLDRSFSYFVDRFVELLQEVLAEREGDPRRYGLLLSGGSDSRLLLAADDFLVAYHLADWMSREARTAERAAMLAGTEFRLLRRPDDHHERMLAHVPRRMNFNGRFDQAHINGFDDRLREEVDVLVTGLYAGSLFKGGLIPTREFDLGRVGSVATPIARDLDSVEEFLDALDGSLPSYLRTPPSLESILREHVRERADGLIAFHGIEYSSLRELIMFSDYYPLSNDRDYHYFGLTQMVPHWTPFLDNRFIDLACSMPIRYHVRRNLIDAALSALSPDLAALPHAETGVPPVSRFPFNRLRKYGSLFWRKHVADERPPRPYYSRGSWCDRGAVLRERGFGRDILERNDATLRSLPFIDREAAYECYNTHMTGEDHTADLYALFTLLETPVVRKLADT